MLGKEDRLTAEALAGLGTAYRCLGRYAEAESSLRRSVSIVEKQPGPELAAILLDLGRVYYLLSSLNQAEAAWRRAAAIVQGVPKATGLRVEILVQQGALAWLLGRLGEAERRLKEAAILAESTFGTSHIRLARVLSLLGDVYTTRKEYYRADDAYQRSIVLVESAMGTEHSSVATVLVRRGLLRQAQGRLDEARLLLERALESTAKRSARSTSVTVSTSRTTRCYSAR